jgi:hypothetical protein
MLEVPLIDRVGVTRAIAGTSLRAGMVSLHLWTRCEHMIGLQAATNPDISEFMVEDGDSGVDGRETIVHG